MLVYIIMLHQLSLSSTQSPQHGDKVYITHDKLCSDAILR